MKNKPTLKSRFLSWLRLSPRNRSELLDIIRSAYQKKLFDSDAFAMIEGAMQVSDTTVRDIMVPLAQMDLININDPIDAVITKVITALHSRFPVIDSSPDEVIGILLAKDLLRVNKEDDYSLKDNLRPVIYIPESKRLNVLLREFRMSRNHMAIVVDEHGGTSGLVTIEDVLEQIVGDIDDEYDFDETADNIVFDTPGWFRIKATTNLEDFNDFFQSNLTGEDFETIGGLISDHLGRLAKKQEVIHIDNFTFKVLRVDSRKIYSLLVFRKTLEN